MRQMNKIEPDFGLRTALLGGSVAAVLRSNADIRTCCHLPLVPTTEAGQVWLTCGNCRKKEGPYERPLQVRGTPAQFSTLSRIPERIGELASSVPLPYLGMLYASKNSRFCLGATWSSSNAFFVLEIEEDGRVRWLWQLRAPGAGEMRCSQGDDDGLETGLPDSAIGWFAEHFAA
jgi:hypothetical protein